MAQSDKVGASHQADSENMVTAIGRALAGALLFSMSLLMTMETWLLGVSINRWQFILFILVNMLLLVGLAYYRGFHEDLDWREAIVDAFVGYAIGVVTGVCFLLLFGVIKWGMAADEIVGKVALQAIPAAIGALLARSQLNQREKNQEEGKEGQEEEQQGQAQAAQQAGRRRGTAPGTKPELPQGYLAEIFLMVAGALFIIYTVAPTDEMIMIAYQMSAWHALVAVLISLLILHIFVYKVEFRGQESMPEGSSGWKIFLYFTVVGYLAVYLTGLYMLWSFGRTSAVELPTILMYGIVLSVPGALGAAVARLIL